MDAEAIRLRVYMTVFAGLLVAGVAGFMTFKRQCRLDPSISLAYYRVLSLSRDSMENIHFQQPFRLSSRLFFNLNLFWMAFVSFLLFHPLTHAYPVNAQNTL